MIYKIASLSQLMFPWYRINWKDLDKKSINSILKEINLISNQFIHLYIQLSRYEWSKWDRVNSFEFDIDRDWRDGFKIIRYQSKQLCQYRGNTNCTQPFTKKNFMHWKKKPKYIFTFIIFCVELCSVLPDRYCPDS